MGCGFEATETLRFERHGAFQIYDAVSVAKRFVNVGTRGEVVSCMFGIYSVRGWVNYGAVLGAVAKKRVGAPAGKRNCVVHPKHVHATDRAIPARSRNSLRE
jgi:hypothetical protein